MYMREATRESAVSEPWREALRTFDRDLAVRSAAESTRRAYANDVGQLAEWASGIEKEPPALGHRDLRRFAARLSDRGISKAGVARKLAAIRAFYAALVRAGEMKANPADLVATPKRDRKLPRVLSREEMQRLLDRIPTRTPLEMRDRAMLELTYSCGLRAEEVVNLDSDAADFEGERLRIEGKGGKTRLVPMGEPAQAALSGYLERAPTDPRRPRRGERPARLQERQATPSLRRPPPPAALGTRGRHRRRCLAARAAALVCDPSPGGRGGPALHPGAARAFEPVHHAGLHPG